MFPRSWLIQEEKENPPSPSCGIREAKTRIEELSNLSALVVVPGRPSTVDTPPPKEPKAANEFAVGELALNGHVPLHTACMQLGASEASASSVNSQKFSTDSVPHSDEAVTGL